MTVINVRSPYVITVGDYGSTQTGSTIILQIYQKGQTPPTVGQSGYYSLSKSIVSATQRETRYNITNYIKEYINVTSPKTVTYTVLDEYLDNWIVADVTTYWNNGGTSTQISFSRYICENGFSSYANGANWSFGLPLKVLTDGAIKKQIQRNTQFGTFAYINVIADVQAYGDRLEVSYYGNNSSGYPIATTLTAISGGDSRGVYNKCIPLSLYPYIDYPTTCYVEIKWIAQGQTYPTFSTTFQTEIIDECKYTPVICKFINRFGGWEFLTFFKAQTNSISVKGTDYKLKQDGLQYDTAIGQFKTMNINGRQTVKLNTGWVDEDYSGLIQDLFLSEIILLDEKPATLKTQSIDFKTDLKDKNINYELEFEYAFNLINDVV